MLLHNFTLLYVEDDKNIQELMKEMMEGIVKSFYQAYNGKEGLTIYKEKKPDIVLTDINMPFMDGLEMASAIKNRDRAQPIVITSAFDDRKILLDAINIGIDGFVVKPVDVELLMNKLADIAQNLQNQIDAKKAREKAFREKERRLHDLAHYDTLTRIPNRFLFNQKFTLAIKNAHKEKHHTALFFIDLDNFKIINDTYGHKAGDTVLLNVVENIKNTIRKSDFLARIGGDEFALIIENISSKKCLIELAKKIIEAASIPALFEQNSLQVSCSIGISMCMEGVGDKKELIHQADLAMYQAKSRGKSGYAFSTEVE